MIGNLRLSTDSLIVFGASESLPIATTLKQGPGRVLIINESALPSYPLVKAHLDLTKYEGIHTLTLDCHNDVGQSNSLGIKGQWSYKKIVPCLPKNLKSLTILNAHGPDLQIIQRAIKQCKDLESLTLGRCTKFNRPNGCEFWDNFPNDHDSYFSGKGIKGYAVITNLNHPKLRYLLLERMRWLQSLKA